MSGTTESVTLFTGCFSIRTRLKACAPYAFIAYAEIAGLPIGPPGEVGVLQLPEGDRELFARRLAPNCRFPASKVSRAIYRLVANGFIESSRGRLMIRDFDRAPASAFLRSMSRRRATAETKARPAQGVRRLAPPRPSLPRGPSR